MFKRLNKIVEFMREFLSFFIIMVVVVSYESNFLSFRIYFAKKLTFLCKMSPTLFLFLWYVLRLTFSWKEKNKD